MCISGRHLNETEKNLSTQEMTEIRLSQFSFSSKTKPGLDKSKNFVQTESLDTFSVETETSLRYMHERGLGL